VQAALDRLKGMLKKVAKEHPDLKSMIRQGLRQMNEPSSERGKGGGGEGGVEGGGSQRLTQPDSRFDLFVK